MLYLLDTNVLIDAHRDYYPVDRVPEFWDWLASMGEQARVKVPLEAYEEVIAGKEDPLTIWLKDNKINLMLDEQVDAGGYGNSPADSRGRVCSRSNR